MKKLVMMLLVLGFTTALLAAAQDTSSQSQSSQSQTQPQQPSTSSSSGSQATPQSSTGTQNDKHMTGKVSSDGKTFTSDKDSKSYAVDNPDALKGHEGQPVALVVRMDPDTNTLHILTVAAPQQP
jgi:predicted lipid-binding transport protein (Tim44 family)